MDHLEFFSRRDFLKDVGLLGTMGAALWSGGCDSCTQQIANRPTRRNIANLANNDPIVQTYRAAVAAMKALPSSDHRNWSNQANIHFNSCPHGNWFFLPWHRAYLLYFERICRKVTGNQNFALPYWNWTLHPAVPDPFWGQSGNALFDPNRSITQSDQADAGFIGATVIENILAQPSFTTFASDPVQNGQFHQGSGAGMLEGTPHNYIHGWIGGDMGAFHSPLDPVFWTHHNMLDCLWVDWNINRNNPNTNDTTWTDRQFTDFFDENGSPVTVNVLTTILYPIFSYQFEPCAPNETGAKLHGRQLEQFLRAGAPSRFEIVLRFPVARSITLGVDTPGTGPVRLPGGGLQTILNPGTKNRAYLTMRNVSLPSKNDFFVRVFLNKPDANSETPLSDVHYAGSFAFFFDLSMPNMSSHPTPGFLVDITATLQKLNQGGSFNPSQTDLTLVAVNFPHREARGETITVGNLEIGVARF